MEESKAIDEAEQKSKEKEIITKYKAKLAAKYQKSGNNFITSEMQVAKPDQVDAILDFDQELDLPEENEKPLQVQRFDAQTKTDVPDAVKARLELLRRRTQQMKSALGLE